MGKYFRSPSQATTTSVSSFSDLSKGAKFRENTKKNYRAFKKFVYNKESGTFCNKTCKHWLLLICFYILFMAILLGIFFGIIILIMCYVKATRSEALFNKAALMPGSSPALSFIPRLACKATTLIWYSQQASAESGKSNILPSAYSKVIDEFLKPYENLNKSLYVNCDDTKPKTGQYCRFSKEELGPCGKQGYGYEINKPCIYLKLNKIVGWVPKRAVDHGDDVQKKIRILCSGITSFDVDHMGNLSFYPGPFFKDYFFPYDGAREYRLPLIGIQFENLNRGFVVGIKCSVAGGVTNMQDENLHTATAFLYIGV